MKATLWGTAVCLASWWVVPVPRGAETYGKARVFERVRDSGIDYINVSGEPTKPNISGSLGSGAAFFDYDQDGDLDLYLVNGARADGMEVLEGLPNRLFRNEGNWRFRDVTTPAGVGHRGWGMGCAVADFDNDGLPDMYVTNLGPNVLYRNRGDGTFSDVSATAQVADTSWGTGAAWIDHDADGDLDLYVANYVDPSLRKIPLPGSRILHAPGVLGDIYCRFQNIPVFCGPKGLVGAEDVFYRNDGDGTFSEATQASGLRDTMKAYGLGVATLDYDDDGLADLYVANDGMPNYLFRNAGGGRFEEMGLAAGAAYNEEGRAEAGMGVAVADVNGDGRLDLFVTNFSHETNTLYVNLGHGVFADRTETFFPGRPSWYSLGWAARFFDGDRDGDEDLFVANGHVFPQVEGQRIGTSYRQPNQVFENQGGERFAEIALPSNDATREHESSRGAVFGDVDDDGDIDAIVINIDSVASVLRNTGAWGGDRHWIGFRLIGRTVNRDALGARVRLWAGTMSAVREIGASGFLSSSDPRLHLGLLEMTRADRLEVQWPDGERDELFGLVADRYHTIVQGRSKSSRGGENALAQRPF